MRPGASSSRPTFRQRPARPRSTLSTRIVWQNDRPAELTGVYRVTGDDLKARNSFEHPDAVTAREVSGLRIDDGELSLEIPPLSFTSIAAR